MSAAQSFLYSILALFLPLSPCLYAQSGSVQESSVAVAVPLLSAPINATWAANYGEVWFEKGFRGFVFEGILDDLRPFPAEESALIPERIPFEESNTGYLESLTLTDFEEVETIPGDWDALQREISGASNRLRAAGITENFLALRFAPDAPWFTNPQWRRLAESRFMLAGRFCHQTRLRGILLDSASDSAFFDYRWEGWPPLLEPTTLAEEARRFGRKLAVLFNKYCPDGVLLIRARPPESCGPLWFIFFEGVMEGMEQSRNGAVVLFFQGSTDAPAPAAYQALHERTERLWEGRLSSQAQEGWKRKGGLAFSLMPVAYQDDIPFARYPLEQYVPSLYGAAVYGRRYVIIDAPEGGWWHIPPDVAEQFSGLYQKGRGRVTFAPPLPRSLDAFLPKLLCSEARILGDLVVGEMPCTVLHREGKTILLAYDGIPEPMHWPLNTGMMTATNLISGEKLYYTPKEGMVSLQPLSAPLLIEGSPLEEYALTASFALSITPPLSAGVTRSRLQLHLSNPFTGSLEGMLTLSSGTRYAFGSSAVPVIIGPGKSFSLTRHLQGLSFQGTGASFTMAFNRPGTLPQSRDFFFSVAPHEKGRLYTDAALSGMPVAVHRKDLGALLIWCDRRGHVAACSTGSPQMQWEKRFRGTFSKAPVLLKDRQGNSLIAFANENNRVRLINPGGTETAVLFPGGTSVSALKVVERADGGDILALLLDRKELVFYVEGTRFIGRKQVSGHIAHLSSESPVPQSVLCVVAEEKKGDITHEMQCLSVTGESLWSQKIESAPALSPRIIKRDVDTDPVICFPDSRGRVCFFEGRDGSPSGSMQLEGMHNPDDMLLLEGRSCLLVFGSATGITVYSAASDGSAAPLWQVDLPGITALAAWPDGMGIIAGTSDGGLYGFTEAGQCVWEDLRGTGYITDLLFLPSETPRAFDLLAAGADGSLRFLEIQSSNSKN